MARPDGHEIHRLVRFAGRDRALEQMREVLEAGGPRVVVVRGAAGVGKTALVAEALRRWTATDAGRVVCRTRAFDRDGLPRRAVADIAAQLVALWRSLPPEQGEAIAPDDVALMRLLVPWLARVPVVAEAVAEYAPRDPLELRSRAFEATRELVVALAELRGIALVVEDAHWLDGTTASLLGYALDEPAAPALTLICTAEPGALPAPVERLVRRNSRALTVELGPLVPEAALEFARDLVSGDDTRAERIATAAGGVPLAIEAYAAVAPGGTWPQAPEDAWRACIARLPEAQRRLVEVCAVAEQPLEVTLAAEVLELAAGEVEALAAGLRAARLCERDDAAGERRVALRHSSIGRAITGALAADERRALHHGLALTLEMQGRRASARVARHLRDAGRPERAAQVARAAADAANRELDFDRAALLIGLARGGSRADEQGQLALAEGQALAHAGRAAAAAERFAEAAGLMDQAARLSLLDRSAGELIRGGHLERGTRAVADALAGIGVRLARSPAAALRAAAWRRLRQRVRGLGWRARSADAIAPSELAAVDVLAGATMSLAVIDNARAAELQARHLARALRLGEPERVARALAIEAGFRASTGDAPRTRAIANAAHRLRKEHGAGDGPYHLWALGAIHYFLESSWREAVDKFDRVESALRAAPRAQGWILDAVQIYGCLSRLYLGAVPELCERVPRYVREAELRGDVYAAVNLQARLNLRWLAADRPERARADLAEVERAWPGIAGRYSVQRYWALFGFCELALYTGDVAAARARLEQELAPLAGSLLQRIPMVRIELEHLQGRVAIASALAAPPEQRAAWSGRALEHARRLEHERPPIAGMFALLLRAAAGRLGADPSADSYLTRARRWLDRSETGLYADVAAMASTTDRAAGIASLRRRGVVRPEALARLLAPGLASD